MQQEQEEGEGFSEMEEMDGLKAVVVVADSLEMEVKAPIKTLLIAVVVVVVVVPQVMEVLEVLLEMEGMEAFCVVAVAVAVQTPCLTEE